MLSTFGAVAGWSLAPWWADCSSASVRRPRWCTHVRIFSCQSRLGRCDLLGIRRVPWSALDRGRGGRLGAVLCVGSIRPAVACRAGSGLLLHMGWDAGLHLAIGHR